MVRTMKTPTYTRLLTILALFSGLVGCAGSGEIPGAANVGNPGSGTDVSAGSGGNNDVTSAPPDEEPLNVTGGSSSPAETTAPSPNNEKSTGLRIGIEADKPGVNLNSGTSITGFDIDIAAYVAMKLGYSPFEIEWVPTTSEEKVEFLNNGTVDMVVSTYSITEERRAEVDFAGPYLIAGQDLLVRADDDSITGTDSLTGKTVCVVRDTTSIERIKELVGDKANYIEEESSVECLPLVLAGEADAATSDDMILAELAAYPDNAGKFRVVGEKFSKEAYGIGLPNGSNEVCQAITAAITDMINDGSWAKFIERNTIGTGYDPTSHDNPPTPDPCEP